jgi:hypothetical protein
MLADRPPLFSYARACLWWRALGSDIDGQHHAETRQRSAGAQTVTRRSPHPYVTTSGPVDSRPATNCLPARNSPWRIRSPSALHTEL